MDLSIIIVNYRGWSKLRECLEMLATFRGERFAFEIIVVDNHSDDGVLDEFSGEFSPYCRFIRNEVNGGFANGCNLGASKAKGEWLLFLNPDTVATEDALASLLERAKEYTGDAVFSCRQVNNKGRESRAYGVFPGLGLLTGTGRAAARLVCPGKLKPVTSGNTVFPDWVSGSVLLTPKGTFNSIGGFDEDYWMYYEDTDLCRRIKNSGGTIVFFNDITITHHHGGSSRVNPRTAALTKSEVLISRHVYINKHLSGLEKSISQSLMIFHNLTEGLLLCITGLPLFFIPKLFIRTLIFLRISNYYLSAIKRRSWVSSLSVNKMQDI